MHALLNAFKAPRPALGVWLTTPGFFHARALALAHPSIDWICLDGEHGMVPGPGGGGSGLAECIAAIHTARAGAGDKSANPPSTLVRIPATGSTGLGSTGWQIKLALDAGARGVVVPMVSNAQQAKEVVADSRFPPVGRRGFGSPYTQMNWGMGLSAAEYLDKANDEVVVVVQIETPEGLENVKEIAEVDGMFSSSGRTTSRGRWGFPAPSPDPVPEIEAHLQHVREKAQAAGKKCGIYCTSGAQAARRVEEGFDMINVISDVGAMTGAVAEHVSAALGSSRSAS
ncbi:Aldolase citrate lyase family protein [Mycena kentingensis (nom. inval.)]|nr:Aldolase citrate lyase family protein [Mycena kentingensis (nom. inval.)]